ncbi:MAG TPA: AsmA family protein [Steroidobacteraceae bacterium]|nr:AsmA family protein [Steroidobacteraceae bacterium]
MKASLVVRRILKWTVMVFVILIVLTAGLLAALEAGYGHALLVRYVALRLGRPVQVNGTLQVQLFSFHPQLVAEHVIIGNPPWTPPGVTAEVGRIAAVFRLPGFWHLSGITGLDVQAATLHLIRDSTGRANWQLRDPANQQVNSNSAILRTLSMLNAHVVLEDARRHLQFVGTASAQDLGGPGPAQRLHIEGAGQLNDRAVTFAVTADPLATASHKAPYHFTFTERSSGSDLDGSGTLPQPFTFEMVDAAFVAAGPDLKDLYFLTGVHLLDTGNYRLTGKLARRGMHTTFDDLAGTSGSSDLQGRVSTDSSSGRPKFDIDLHSRVLKLSDFGLRAAGRTSQPKSPLLLSDAMISPNVLHAAGATVKYHADRVEVGRLPFEAVSLDANIGHDVLTVAPLLAKLAGGRVTAHLTLDGSKELAAANVDLRITDLQLGQLVHKDTGPSPVEGLVQAQIRITGQGRSVHQVAASANGTVTAHMPLGALRRSFAELTDLDLRGLGLLLTKSEQEVPVRCARVQFKAENGTLTAQDLIVDTDPVLITGAGQIHLDSEALDLSIRGNAKSLRLFRVRTPVLVQGTLAHPTIHIPVKDSRFMLADPGRAKDVDCAALLAGR